MKIVNGLPRGNSGGREISQASREHAKTNNQFALSGGSPQFPLTTGAGPALDTIVFLQYVQATGTFSIADGAGNVLFTGLGNIALSDGAELRFDGGIRFSGTILLASGYYINVQNIDG